MTTRASKKRFAVVFFTTPSGESCQQLHCDSWHDLPTVLKRYIADMEDHFDWWDGIHTLKYDGIVLPRQES